VVPATIRKNRGAKKQQQNSTTKDKTMNTSTVLKRAVVVTILVSAGSLVASAENYGSSGLSKSEQTTKHTQTQKINRVSELIGMNVKNAQGEKLGEIKDVVIDFSRDRIGYVVLTSDPGVLKTEKLHAVPLRAFQPGADGSSLTLNADKQKMAMAQGFSKDNWPDPANPAWGAQPFWQETGSSTRPGQYDSDRNDSTTDPTPRPGTTPGATPGTTPR
jgi:sporulation protein YlmC with PRC-barrel domain